MIDYMISQGFIVHDDQAIDEDEEECIGWVVFPPK